MKISQDRLNHPDMKVSGEPKFRNIYEEKEVFSDESTPGVDFRIKLVIGFLGILILVSVIRGSITESSLTSRLEEQQKLLDSTKAEALVYGITEDEDGELVYPEPKEPTDISDMKWDSVEERNRELLASFTDVLLHWEGASGYTKARQSLIDDWEFKEDSRLLTSFMPVLDDELNASMTCSGYTPFVLENDGKNISYFLICKVRNTIDGTAATGTVGIRITINEDGTISNVTAQTLS